MMKANETATLEKNKGQLAKLMAAENITVHHRQVHTAWFDLKNRILTCPIWKDMSGNVYDLLMGHEISHALNTPLAGWHSAIVNDKKRKNLKRFLNVIEDARIERIIKSKYPGLRKPFADAYQELYERDMFKIKKLKGDYSSLKLIDRINLYFKMGAQTMVAFDQEEQKFVDRITTAETWEQVEQLAREVYDYQKYTEPKKDEQKKQDQEKKQQKSSKQPKQEQKDPGEESDSEEGDDSEAGETGDEGEESEAGDESDEDGDDSESDSDDGEETTDGGEESDETGDTDGEGEETDQESDEESDDKAATPSSSKEGGQQAKKDPTDEKTEVKDEEVPEPDSETDKAFRDAEESMNDRNAVAQVYYNIPEVNLKNIIVPVAHVLEQFEYGIRDLLNNHYMHKMNYDAIVTKMGALFHARNKNYVSLLLKEFEMRKNANQYARQLVSKTGELDGSKLAKYRFSNDIFKKMTTITKGKSHGMVMFIDLSSSMEEYLRYVVEQTLILVTFCKRVGIPFDVYGYTDGHNYSGFDKEQFSASLDPNNTVLFTTGGFVLRHLISSKLQGNAFKRAFNMVNMMGEMFWAPGRSAEVAKCFASPTWMARHDGSCKIHMRGTPYIETLVASIEIIKQFKQEHHVDIVSSIYLSDGDGNNSVRFPSNAFANVTVAEINKTRYGFMHKQTKLSALCKEPGLGLSNYNFNMFQAAITELVGKVSGCRHIGYFFSEAHNIVQRLAGFPDFKATIGKYRDALVKNGFVAVPALGYNTYYYVDVNQAKNNTEEFISSTMTNDQMHQAFKTNQDRKANNKMIIKQFAKEVAE